MGKRSYSGKRVLVTGGGGFIGSALAKRLIKEGAIVFATARERSPWRLSGEKRIRVLVADLKEEKAMKRAVRIAAPEIIFHTASTIRRNQSLDGAGETIEETFGITKRLALAAVAAGVTKFVQFGTIEEYIGGKAPYRENGPEAPISPYSLGKTLATHFVLGLGRLSRMAVCVVRPAATFGPAQSAGMLIPNIIGAGIAGKDFNMNPGGQYRDFLYIDDLVEGVLRAGINPKSDGQIINLGSGRKVKVKTLVTALNAAMGNPISVNFGAEPYRQNDSMLTLLDIAKARKLLGWKPHTPLNKALEKTALWYTQHHKKYNIFAP